MSRYLDEEPVIIGCPDIYCINNAVDVSAGTKHYYKHSPTKAGSKRCRCRACGSTVTIPAKPALRQRLPYKNKLIFKLLMNKSPLKRICEVAEVSKQTVYDKIEFIHPQCLDFIGDRERRLLPKLDISRLYLATDRQEYIVNWTNTRDKRNVVLKGIATVDMRSNYVFGIHVNYDESLSPEFVALEAVKNGDPHKAMALRNLARVWLEVDQQVAGQLWRVNSKEPIPLGALEADIKNRYEQALLRREIEASDDPAEHIMLPQRGVQIHEEYTMYGHFLFLKHLLSNVEKLRFYLDQDSGMRAACLSIFGEEVLDGRVDAFYVRINKDLKRHEKQKLVDEAEAEMEAMRHRYPDLTDRSIRLLKIADEMKRMKTIGKWEDRWLEYPFPDKSEPEKAVCYLTDRNDLEEMHLANLYHMASLYAVDSFFNRIRARISILDRPKKSRSDVNRIWTAYMPYNPVYTQKLLDMFRVYHNYHLVGEKDTETPAMKLGLAKAPIPVEDIIDYPLR